MKILNDPLCDECDPTQWVSVSREVILHFLKNRVSTTKCLFSCLQHINIKKHLKDEIYFNKSSFNWSQYFVLEVNNSTIIHI